MMTNPWARTLARLLTALTCAVALLPGAGAQDAYPNAALTMIVGWPPGGPSDNVARLIAAKMSTELGQSIVIDPWGVPLAQQASGAGVVLAEMDLAQLRQRRSQLPALTHRVL